jgi:hypothetical protein
MRREPSWILAILPLALLGPPACAHAQATPAQPTVAPIPRPALLPGGRRPRTTVPVLPDEFQIQAFDPTLGVIQVTLPPEFQETTRARERVRVRAEAPLLVPVSPALFHDVIEAKRNGRVALDLEVEPVGVTDENADLPTRPDDLPEVRPTGVRLNIERIPVAEGDLGPARRVSPGGVEVGRPHTEAGPLSDEAGDALASAAERIARACAQKTQMHVPSVRGALVVELERTAVGQRLRPQVVVDVTVCNRLVDCVTDAMAEDEALFDGLLDGQRAFLPIYFKDAPAPTAAP